MKALQISSFGSPTDVVELAEIEPQDPGSGRLAVAIVDLFLASQPVAGRIPDRSGGHQGWTWEP